MNDIFKFGLIGAGAWLFYTKLFSPASAPVAAAPASGAAITPAPATQPAAIATAQVSATKDLVMAAARASLPADWDGLLSADQWNYYYAQVRGVPGPDPLVAWPARERGFRMGLEEWWAGGSAAGLTGLSNYARVYYV